jgi:hypothetical protein
MALVVATPQHMGNMLRYIGGTGVNTGDVVVQTGDVSRYDTFELITTAGACDVWVSLDGVNYINTTALALTDKSSTTPATRVVVTAANRVYEFTGKFALIQVKQNGATAATAVTLVCGAATRQL